jgi:RNA polymerase sigma factor (sigma-70 family)
MTDVTRILSAIEQGDPHAAGQLLPLVYEELRKLAAQKLSHEKPGQTLQATALVHEAYLRLVTGSTSSPLPSGGEGPGVRGEVAQWNSRGHFYAAAAEAMRRILIENARRKKTEKHGGARQRVDLADLEASTESRPESWLILDDALSCLAREDPAAAEIAKLRLYAGLSVEDAGQVLNISRATAFRHWTYARAWLNAKLGEKDEPKKP